MNRHINAFVFVSTIIGANMFAQPVEIARFAEPLDVSTSDGRHLYIHESFPSGRIWRVDQESGVAGVIWSSPEPVVEMATDGLSLYYTSFNGPPDRWQLWRLPAGGGARQLIVESIAAIVSPRVDGNSIYWFSPSSAVWREGYGSVRLADAAVHRSSIFGGFDEVMASGLLVTHGELHSGEGMDSVFLLADLGILRIPKLPGVPELIFSDPNLLAFVNAPPGAVWFVSRRATGNSYRLQLWRAEASRWPPELTAELETHAAPLAVEAQVTADESGVFMTWEGAGPNSYHARTLLWLELGAPTRWRTLLQDFDVYGTFGVKLMSEHGGEAFVAVAARGQTGRTILERLRPAVNRVRPARR